MIARRLLLGALVFSLVGCRAGGGAATTGPTSTDAGAGGAPASSVAGSPTESPSAAPPGASPSDAAPADGTFTNPVIDRNFADPFILEHDGVYHAYATGDLTVNIQVSTSPDLLDWADRREALPRLPFWQPSSKGLTWAPEVVETSAGFVMHYTARDVASGKQCLAVAVADDPDGPFVDGSDEPFFCQQDLGGSIDSHPFQDGDGQRYLVWKSDGNCCGIEVRMFIAPLSADGLELTGPAQVLEGVGVDAPWEGNLVEAPSLLLHDGTYYLFYSANDYGSRDYAIGYATATDVHGPYRDAEDNPILRTGVTSGSGEAAGPGHQSIVVDDDGDLWLAYHAWDSGLIGDALGGRRALWLDELVIAPDGRVSVDGPDVGPQAVP